MPPIQITEAARRLGISTRTIRFYEEKGLLSLTKDPVNSYRLFEDGDLLRLETILVLREAGLPIPDLHNVLETYGMGRKEETRYLLELQRSLLYAKRLELDDQILLNEELIIRMVQEGEPWSSSVQHQAGRLRKQRELRGSWVDHYRFDQKAESFDAQVENSGAFPGYEAAIRMTVSLLAPQPGELGVDIGAGTGNLAEALRKTGAVIKGIDQSRQMLQVCRRKFPTMETRLGNAMAIPYQADSFDFAASGYVFHLLTPDQQRQAVSELLRVLKPGGRFVIGAPLPIEAWSPLLPELDGWKTALSPLPGAASVHFLHAVSPDAPA